MWDDTVVREGGDREASRGVNALVRLLLDDGDVAAVAPDLESKVNHSDGSYYRDPTVGQRAGPFDEAEAGALRQWSGATSGRSGDVWSVTSSAIAYPTAQQARAALRAVVDDLLPSAVVSNQAEFRTVVLPPKGGLATATALTTVASRLVRVEVQFVLKPDDAVLRRLLEAALS